MGLPVAQNLTFLTTTTVLSSPLPLQQKNSSSHKITSYNHPPICTRPLVLKECKTVQVISKPLPSLLSCPITKIVTTTTTSKNVSPSKRSNSKVMKDSSSSILTRSITTLKNVLTLVNSSQSSISTASSLQQQDLVRKQKRCIVLHQKRCIVRKESCVR
jgi:hypothetical protein